MASPLRISGRIDLDAGPAVQGGQVAVAAVASIGTAADQTSSKLDKLEQAAAGLGTAADRNVYAERVKALGNEGRALDDLRARYNPLYATMRTYKQEVAGIQAAHAAGILSTKEMTSAMEQQRQTALRSVDALRDRSTELKQAAANQNAPQNFNTANIAAQFQDIGVTAAMGMSPLQIALQQGTQLSSVLASMDRPVAGLVAAFTSLLSPISLVTIAAVAGAAALIQYFGSAAKESKTVEDVLKEQSEAIKRVRDLWGEAADKSSRYGRVSTQAATFGLQNSIFDLQKRLRDSVKDQSLGDAIAKAKDKNDSAIGLSAPEFRETDIFKTLKADFDALHAATITGSPDVLRLAENLERIGSTSNNAGIRQLAADALEAIQPYRDLAEALRQAEQERVKLFNDRGPNGLLLSRGTTNREDMGNLALYQQQQEVQRKREREAYEAELARMRAKSPQERSAAARQSASAEYNDTETPETRRQRIERAGTLELLGAEKQLADARRSRDTALQTSIERQQLEASLIGKTVSEQERLRLQFQLTSELKAEAARNGTAVDEKELALIREKAAAYGQLAEQMAAQKALREQDTELEKLRSELGLVTMSQSARAEAMRQLETENKIRELGISRNSTEADQLREKSRLIGQMTTELAKQKAAWDMVSSAGESAIDNIFGSLLKGDFKGALKGLLGDVGKFFQDLGTNSIKNMLLGGDRTELSDVIGRLMKGAPVAANQNTPAASAQSFAAPVEAVTRSVLGSTLSMVGNYKSGVDARLTDILNKAALASPQFKVDAISGFRAGDPRFHGQGIATDVSLTDLMSGRKLGNYQDAASFRSYEQFAQSARAVQMRDYPELADKFRWGGYFSGGKGKYGAVDNMHFDLAGNKVGMGGGSWEGGLNSAQRSLWPGAESKGIDDTASKALEKLATAGQTASKTIGGLEGASSTAVKGLSGLGEGLGQAGQNLANMFPAAPSGGGGGGFFSSLLTAFLPNFIPNGAQANFAVSNPGKGLYDTGGWTGDGARDAIAGYVHGQEYVVKASVVAKPGVRELLENLNAGRSSRSSMSVPRISAPAPVYPTRATSDPMFAINGHHAANRGDIIVNVENPRGDRDIEEAVDRGVSKGLRAYDKNLPTRVAQIKKRPLVRGQ
jgi:hypothetical protein